MVTVHHFCCSSTFILKTGPKMCNSKELAVSNAKLLISIYYNKVARNGPNKFNVKYFLENYLIKIMNFFAKKRSTKIKGNRFWVKMVFHEMVMQIGSGLSLSVTR